MSWALIALFALLIAALAYVCARSLRTLARVEEMLDRAVEGGFSCEHYDETRLSRLEARMARYLSAGGAAREALSRERDELQSLVSDVAHQARLPASNLLLYSQLLSEAPELSGRSRELAAQLEGQAEKLRFLMEALVKVSRLESGIIALRPRAQGVSRLLQALDFGLAAAQKGVRLEIADAAEISARYDLKWTLEALSNLVDNAVKYTPPGGKVRVSAHAYELFARVDVRDSGPGFSEDESAKLFARFYRAPGAAEQPGLGLGLYLAREIAAREGGYIRAKSAPGQGATFSLFLPRQI